LVAGTEVAGDRKADDASRFEAGGTTNAQSFTSNVPPKAHKESQPHPTH